MDEAGKSLQGKEVFATDSVGVANVTLMVNGRICSWTARAQNILASLETLQRCACGATFADTDVNGSRGQDPFHFKWG